MLLIGLCSRLVSWQTRLNEKCIYHTPMIYTPEVRYSVVPGHIDIFYNYLLLYSYQSIVAFAIANYTSTGVPYFPCPCAVGKHARATSAVLLRHSYGNVQEARLKCFLLCLEVVRDRVTYVRVLLSSLSTYTRLRYFRGIRMTGRRGTGRASPSYKAQIERYRTSRG